MKPSTFSRVSFGGAMAIAFLSGLIFASSFDLTRSTFAQQTRPAANTPPPATSAATATMADLSMAFTSIAEHVTPAVVSIQAERTQPAEDREQQRRPNRSPLEDFFRQFEPERLQPRQSSGTGFIVSPDGYILTNNHVVAGFDRVRVTLTDRRTFTARVVGRDETTDVAVVKIDAKNLPVAQLGDDHTARVGEWVVAIGNPLGLDFTVTAGIISAKGRGRSDVQVNVTNQWAINDFIQTDAAINPGNSGGPLVNIRGEVIGINTAIASQTGFYAGYGFAIPITLAQEVMEDLIEHGRVRRAMLGVSIRDITEEDAAVAGLDKIAGVLVEPFNSDQVNGPADKAGVEPGDVIVKADGREVDRVSTLQRIIRSHEPGETVALEVMRYGQRRSFNVRLGEVPTDGEARAVATRESNERNSENIASEKLGIGVQPITEEMAAARRVPSDVRGLLVVEVDPYGPAGRGRLVPGDVIMGVISPTPRRDIRTTNDLQQVLSRVRDGGYVSLIVYSLEFRTRRIVNLRVGD